MSLVPLQKRSLPIKMTPFTNLAKLAQNQPTQTGLSAARELRAYGMDVLVLEARDRVGGRTLTKVSNDRDGKLWCDLGGSYVGPTQDCVLNLIDELKLETYLVDDIGDVGYVRANKIDTSVRKAKDSRTLPPANNIVVRSRFHPLADPPFGNIFHWLDYVHMVRLIDSYGAQIPSEAPWNAPKAREWDKKTFKQFVDESCWTDRVRGYFNNVYTTIDICAEPEEVSMLWFLWYIKQCGGYGRSIATTNGGQERKIKGGTQQLSVGLQEIVGRQRILLNKPVCRIDQTSGPFVVVSTLDGSQYKADYLICAISPHLLLKIHHQPALPAPKNLLAQRSPMGQVAKVILYYDRPFWKEHNYSGGFFFDSIDRVAQPVIISLDETKPDGKFAAIIGFVCSNAWLEMRDKSDQEVGRLVARSYVDCTKLNEFMNFKRVERFDWTQEQYTGGCYTTTHTTLTLTKFGKHLREPFGRIYYAGTETATKWSGYMDGAISAGKRAARQVLHITGNLEEDEIWRHEPESSTVPPKPFDYPLSHRYAPSIDCLYNWAKIFMVTGLLSFIAYKRNDLFKFNQLN